MSATQAEIACRPPLWVAHRAVVVVLLLGMITCFSSARGLTCRRRPSGQLEAAWMAGSSPAMTI